MTVTHATSRQLPDVAEEIISQAGGENPLRFLAMDSTDTDLGLIAGMTDPDRIDAWRQCELEHVDPPRDDILDALRKREEDLGIETSTSDKEDQSDASNESDHRGPVDTITTSSHSTDSDPTHSPEAPLETSRNSRDGGVEALSTSSVEESPASDESNLSPPINGDSNHQLESSHPAPGSDPTPDDTHPDGDLSSTEVIVVDRGPKTEYIFPTTDDHDEPYLSRAYNEDGSLWMELEIDGDDLRKRRQHDHERTHVEEISIDPPRQAATAEVLPA